MRLRRCSEERGCKCISSRERSAACDPEFVAFRDLLPRDLVSPWWTPLLSECLQTMVLARHSHENKHIDMCPSTEAFRAMDSGLVYTCCVACASAEPLDSTNKVRPFGECILEEVFQPACFACVEKSATFSILVCELHTADISGPN